MKSLIWKEWREQRLFFFLAVGIILLTRSISAFVDKRRYYIDYADPLFHFIFPALFSLFLGAIPFTNEFTRNTKSFLLGHPVTTSKLFWVKYSSGLIILLLIVSLSHLVSGVPFGSIFSPVPSSYSLFYFFSYVILLYSAACFSSLLLKNTLTAIICTPFITLFGIFLILPLVIVLLLICPSIYIFKLSVFSAIMATLLIFSFFTWQKALVKDVSPRRIVLNITAVILLFSLTSHAIANLAANREFSKTILQAKEKGISLTEEEVIPQMIPYKDNAAIVYQEAFNLLDKLKDKYKKEWKYMPYEGGIPVEKLAVEQKNSISRIMKDPEFVKFYTLIEKAVNMPACRFYISYKGFALNKELQPILAKIRSLTRLLAARTYILSEEKRYGEALKSAKTALSVGDSLSNEPVLITHLVRIAIDTLAIKSYSLLLSVPKQSFSSNDYREISKIIDRKNRKLTIAIEGEPVLFNGYNMKLLYLNMGKETSRVKQTPFRVCVAYMLNPRLKTENAFYMQSIMKLVHFFNQPYYSTKDSLVAWQKKIAPEAKLPPRYVLARMAIPALSRSLVQQVRYNATLDTFKLALALKIYREKHGKYPDSLSSLAPEVIPELPIDPFTGKDYIYRREGRGFIVYSVGPNEKDDGGVYNPKQSLKYDDIAFRVRN